MMFRKSRTQRTTEMLRDVIGHAGDALRDEKLRSDLSAAVGHGMTAADRLRQDSGLAEFASRLEDDKELRRSLRLLVDDVDSAGKRLRANKRHRIRNALVILGGTGVVVAVAARARRWSSENPLRSAAPTTSAATPV